MSVLQLVRGLCSICTALGAALWASGARAQETTPDPLRFQAFADANHAYTSARSGSRVALHRAFEANTGDFLTHNGFSLSWLGVDVSYEDEHVAATGSLRFGSAVPVYWGGNASDLGVENLTQAYGTWKPAENLRLDLGLFDTIYGVEVAESWKNLNYTRGALYTLMQPFFHTGLRVSHAATDAISLSGLVVNGANNLVDENDTPSIGAQMAITPSDQLLVSLGYLGSLQPSNSRDVFDNFLDLVSRVSVGDLRVDLNGSVVFSTQHQEDYDQDGRLTRVVQTPTFGGVSLGVGYQFTPLFGAALRGEFLQDTHNRLYRHQRAEKVNLTTVTLTLDVTPVEDTNNLVLRWDNRLEASNHDIFFTKSGRSNERYFESVIGVLVKTND